MRKATKPFGYTKAVLCTEGSIPMIKPEEIPDEVVETAAINLMGRLMVSHQDALHVWSGMYEPAKYQFRREARAAIAAAINAWPGMGYIEDVSGWDVHIELPLPVVPQEKNDE